MINLYKDVVKGSEVHHLPFSKARQKRSDLLSLESEKESLESFLAQSEEEAIAGVCCKDFENKVIEEYENNETHVWGGIVLKYEKKWKIISTVIKILLLCLGIGLLILALVCFVRESLQFDSNGIPMLIGNLVIVYMAVLSTSWLEIGFLIASIVKLRKKQFVLAGVFACIAFSPLYVTMLWLSVVVRICVIAAVVFFVSCVILGKVIFSEDRINKRGCKKADASEEYRNVLALRESDEYKRSIEEAKAKDAEETRKEIESIKYRRAHGHEELARLDEEIKKAAEEFNEEYKQLEDIMNSLVGLAKTLSVPLLPDSDEEIFLQILNKVKWNASGTAADLLYNAFDAFKEAKKQAEEDIAYISSELASLFKTTKS